MKCWPEESSFLLSLLREISYESFVFVLFMRLYRGYVWDYYRIMSMALPHQPVPLQRGMVLPQVRYEQESVLMGVQGHTIWFGCTKRVTLANKGDMEASYFRQERMRLPMP